MDVPDDSITRRLLLRPVRETDVEAVWRIHSDPATYVHHPAGPMTEHDAAVELTQQLAGNWSRDGIGYWAIERIDRPGEVIGFGGIRRTEAYGFPAFNLYYRLAASAWGQGYATELSEAAVQRWRQLTESIPLIVCTTAENAAARATAARAGLERRTELDRTVGEVAEIFYGLESG